MTPGCRSLPGAGEAPVGCLKNQNCHTKLPVCQDQPSPSTEVFFWGGGIHGQKVLFRQGAPEHEAGPFTHPSRAPNHPLQLPVFQRKGRSRRSILLSRPCSVGHGSGVSGPPLHMGRGTSIGDPRGGPPFSLLLHPEPSALCTCSTALCPFACAGVPPHALGDTWTLTYHSSSSCGAEPRQPCNSLWIIIIINT